MHCPTTLLTPKKLDNSQRHKIFWTLCTIRNKVCNVIIDSGSSENVVSKALVKVLRRMRNTLLRTRLHGLRRAQKFKC